MKKIWIIAIKDVGEAFRSRSIYVILLIMVLVSFSYTSSFNGQVNALTDQQTIRNVSRSFLNSLAYLLPLLYSVIVCSVFANYSVILDKAKRNIESLMATPAGIKQIWMGKSLAVTLPSIVIGISFFILVYIVLNFSLVMPKTHVFIFPDVLPVVSALFVLPVLIFSIVTVVVHIQLIITNPRIANLAFTGIFILLVYAINVLGSLGLSISFFPLIYLAVIILCSLASFILSLSLTKEKVLLSSKM
jgi:ABC-type transport system involved in multi-copper enzyme maturation permease subunit